MLATCAAFARADGWDQVAAFGRAKQTFSAPYLRLPNGVPSPDTFERVFAKLDPNAFADRFGRWMAAACESTGRVHVAIGGKRAPFHRGHVHRVLALVEAWAVENRLILGRRAVRAGTRSPRPQICWAPWT
ncbi:ISAs1 family transposase [Gemmata sp. G18]|uniref:ISAs1 family transposase n=1 Tax=Gemmata palustris TaxID=2822762 RepID=A0ABS5BL59_9BACT|nr:ISAs1 family transposase [Gemmata palustris]